MKANIIVAALALCLVGAPVAANAAGVESTAMPAKKTAKKSTKSTKKSSSKKTAAKAATTAAAPAAAETVKDEATTSKSSGSSLLGSVLGSVLGGSSKISASSSQSGNGVLSALTTIFDAAKGATKNNIVGTWTYTEPAVVFESNNALKNIGGKVASSVIESKLQAELEKYGIKKGALTMTFDDSGNFTQTINGRELSGTYTVDKGKVSLKYGGMFKQLVGTTQVDGNDLLIVMDADKLLSFAKTVGSLTGNSLLKSAGNILGSMDGMEVGLKLNK